MKVSIYLLLILFSGITVSCDKEDDPIPPQNTPLIGMWNLTHIRGGFAGVDISFKPGVITWNFNKTDTLTVTNNHLEGEILYNGLETGTYPYNTPGNDLIIIDNSEYTYSISKNKLTIKQSITDGYIFYFQR